MTPAVERPSGNMTATRVSPGLISLSSSRDVFAHLYTNACQSGYVATGSRETSNEPYPDRITTLHDDRDPAG